VGFRRHLQTLSADLETLGVHMLLRGSDAQMPPTIDVRLPYGPSFRILPPEDDIDEDPVDREMAIAGPREVWSQLGFEHFRDGVHVLDLNLATLDKSLERLRKRAEQVTHLQLVTRSAASYRGASVEPPSAPSPFTLGLRLIMGLLGAGSFGAGVLAVFATENGAGAGMLLAFGGVLLVLALLGNRIESFEFGGAKLRLRAAAAERFALAEESERRGDTATADRLRAEAQALLDAAGPIAADYRSVRGSMRAGPQRTRALEEVVARARRLAAEQPFEPAEVLHWLREGSEEERITALAMMQAKRELRNFDAALAAIKHPRSPFEQYHAMLLTAKMIDELDSAQRRRLAEAIKAERGLRFRRDRDRWRLSEDILRRVDGRSDAK